MGERINLVLVEDPVFSGTAPAGITPTAWLKSENADLLLLFSCDLFDKGLGVDNLDAVKML